MPYAPAIRHWYTWDGYLPTWAAVTAGLALFPQSLYMFLLSLPPLFTSSVMLLDAGPAFSAPVVGAVLAATVAAVGWLLSRFIAGFDETKAAVNTLTALVTEMRLERKDDRQLTNYLKDRQDKLEKENETLRISLAAIDKQIAVAMYRKEHPGA